MFLKATYWLLVLNTEKPYIIEWFRFTIFTPKTIYKGLKTPPLLSSYFLMGWWMYKTTLNVPFLFFLEVHFCGLKQRKDGKWPKARWWLMLKWNGRSCFPLLVKWLNWCQSPRDKGLLLWNIATPGLYSLSQDERVTPGGEWGLSRAITIRNDVWDDRN